MRKFLLVNILFLVIPAICLCQDGPIGWASVSANGQDGTTGGAGGAVVTVSTMADLIYYCGLTDPYIIQVDGIIPVTPKGRHIAVRSNKTIVGLGANSGIYEGGFSVGNNQKNIIFRNLTISDTYVEGDWDGKTQDWDGIQIKGTCSHIWIHHCTFLRQGDGAVDITNGANYITISYTKFGENNKASLIGSSDTDTHTDKYKVTIHHCWYNETTQRHPRVRFGQVHLFNNYYYNMGGYGREMGYANSNGYGIGIGVSAQIYSEKNYFEKVVYPSQFYDNAEKPGYMIDIGSHFVESGTMAIRPEGINWNPADFYDYTLDDAETVKETVMTYAGVQDTQTSNQIMFTEKFKLDLVNYPNPFTDYTNLAFEIPIPGIARLSLKDITGREIRVISLAHYSSGRNEILLNRENLNPGIYILMLEFQGRAITRKVVVH